MKQLHLAAKWKIITIGNSGEKCERLRGEASRGILKQLAIISARLMFVMIIACPAYADTDSGQSPVTGNHLDQKSKQELLNIMQLIITRHPEIGKELSEQPEDPPAVPKKPVETATTERQPEQKTEDQPLWMPKVLGLQFNGIYQNVPGFRSPYEGDHSFRTDGGLGHNITHIYGVYLGSQLAPSLQAYLDVEMAKGSGISKGQGLGGYTNGDVIRVGSADLGSGPYVARAYLRYLYPLSTDTEQVERAQDQLPGNEPVGRIEIKAGKMSAADDFDLNRYANNTRTQFLNYSFINNTAWDYAADTRGYSYGFVASLVQPKWRLAFGMYMEPTFANGATFDTEIFKSQGSNLELTLKPNEAGTVIRVLTFLNQARMGNYDEALAVGRDTSATPDVRADEKPGRTKYGFGLNFEQPLADDGETGIFSRMGWNDGNNETFAYTEVDREVSLGVQISGIHWERAEDHWGIAYAVDGLSSQHKTYLASGGLGMLLGDGNLSYGLEQIFETYYRVQIGKYVQVSPDFQYILNPGYNRDRGPATVYSMRVRMSY
ncbi:MAG: carbohydrate porin [Dissulfurispiraceae bacterium]